jgi:hypothetical protein
VPAVGLGADAAAGDTTGGDTTGGDTTGGDAAGGDTTGGDTTGGDAVVVSTLVAGWALSQIQPGTKGTTADWKPPTEAVPAETPDPPQLLPSVDPQLLEQLETRFQDVVDQKIKEGYFVMNTDWIGKGWNWTVGLLSNPLQGNQGGQCQEFAEWGQEWSQGSVQEIFGEHAIVDTIYVQETSTRYPDGHLAAADALYEANHTATRVILPTGESYVLDYWAAVGGGPSSQKGCQADTGTRVGREMDPGDWRERFRGIQPPSRPEDTAGIRRKVRYL